MFPDELKELLLATFHPSAPASGGKLVVMKCRYCLDSKDPKHMHFYVSLGYDDNIPMFYCHKCGASGVVTNDILMQWGIYDVDIGSKITKYNTRLFKMPKNMKYKDSEVYRLNNNFITMNELSEKKLKYINTRLNSNLSYQDLLNMKIVLNLGDLLQTNHVDNLTRAQNLVEELDRSFLGFLSQDNAFVNMRNLRQGKVPEPIDKKYVNYNIFGKVDNTQRFYTIPNKIDLNNPNRIKIHIGEGPFDILSVFLNLRKELNHNIYSAICGSGYLNIIKHFIIRMKLINVEYHIYKDNDVDDYIITNIADILYPFKIPLYLHSNIFPGEKDFGVPISKIKEQIMRIM